MNLPKIAVDTSEDRMGVIGIFVDGACWYHICGYGVRQIHHSPEWILQPNKGHNMKECIAVIAKDIASRI